MSEYRFLKTRREGAALVVELTNLPRNLLNAPMVAELTALADELSGGVGQRLKSGARVGPVGPLVDVVEVI